MRKKGKEMRVVVHDLSKEKFEQISNLFSSDDRIYSVKDTPKSCMGCFGCWLKTPGQCVLKDDYQKIGEECAKASEMIMISECIYGGYGPEVKSVVDRSISFLMPFFVTKKNETHHLQRYEHTFPLQVFFYGKNLSIEEKETAKSIIKANQKNFYFSKYSVSFSNSFEELKENVQSMEGLK